ncbi:uncharacterized protein LOC120485420 [Pimephales promelas]|uniref:uncharacterized protein LOC120485420 n=1 Tax=Pimephales promelas TaxID=90988 RepID=UPI001955AAB2|nr:uncharacterized protein LOC120485420 [Pimephales promelas]
MADIDEFVSSPSHELLNGCTKEQLLSIAEHYEIVIKDKRLKENVKTALKIELIKQGILDIEMEEKDVPIAPDLKSNLSFEQQKELLLLQMDHENIKLRAEQGKRELEKAKLDLEFLKLNLVKEEGRVSLVGEKEEIPVKILRDTGAMDSFILESVLPFSSQSHTGESVLIRGIGLNTLSVPLHKVRLQSDLIQGEVVMGVRPALPVEGVHIILGNGLVGERVWADTSVFPIVITDKKVESELSSLCQDSACVVTRAMKGANRDVVCGQKEVKSDKVGMKLFMPDLSALSFPVSAEELGKEQRNDSSLDELFRSAVPPVEECNVSRGYFVQDGVLLGKWSPHKNFVGDPVFQVLKQLHIKHNQSTAYHAQSQGALERFHQSLKSLLRAYCVQLDRDWEEGLPWMMLAAREVVQESFASAPSSKACLQK